MEPRTRVRVVSLDLEVTDLSSAADQVIAWTAEASARYVCAANVHMTMEAHDSPAFQRVVNSADSVVPDGAPLVWALRALGHRGAGRVFGPDLMESVLERAAAAGIPVGFHGSTPETLAAMSSEGLRRWPRLRIVHMESPPFRSTTIEEEEALVARWIASGARLLLVGLGCPKQELWMAAHASRLPCVMVGVGQAFDVLAGVRRRPPAWMHRAGLGWLYRLIKEPRRLWRRQLASNPRFLVLFAQQYVRALR